jgi:hypothetical protein
MFISTENLSILTIWVNLDRIERWTGDEAREISNLTR